MRKEDGPFTLFPGMKGSPMAMRSLTGKVGNDIAQPKDSVRGILGIEGHVLFRTTFNVRTGPAHNSGAAADGIARVGYSVGRHGKWMNE